MRTFRMVVIGVILTAMFSGAAPDLAKSEPTTAPISAETMKTAATLATTATKLATGGDESSQYAQREQQTKGVQDFRGGFVYVYFGSGLVLALVIILLILVL